MKISKSICALFAAVIMAVFGLWGCNSAEPLKDNSPRDFTCVLKYTGKTYMPKPFNKPYKYAIYDINGNFIAYVDSTRLVVPRMDQFIDKLVIIRGAIATIDDDPVLRAEYLKIARP